MSETTKNKMSGNKRAEIKAAIDNFSAENLKENEKEKFDELFAGLANDLITEFGNEKRLKILSFGFDHTRDFVMFVLDKMIEKREQPVSPNNTLEIDVFVGLIPDEKYSNTIECWEKILNGSKEFEVFEWRPLKFAFKNWQYKSQNKSPRENPILQFSHKTSPVLLNIHHQRFDNNSIISPSPAYHKKFHLIFCCFFLHFQQNWRIWLPYLFSLLKSEGTFIFGRVFGDFEILDCRFEQLPELLKGEKSHLTDFFDFMQKFDAHRSKHSFYWQPELGMSQTKALENHVRPIFGSLEKFHFKYQSYQEAKPSEVALSSIQGLIDFWIKQDRNKGVISSLDIGVKIDKNQLGKFVEGYTNSKKDLELVKKLELAVAKKIQKQWAEIPFPLITWSFEGLFSKILKIDDREFKILSKKALDLLTTHDIFIPSLTHYCAILGWDKLNRSRKKNIQIAINKDSKNSLKFFEQYLVEKGKILPFEEFFLYQEAENYPVRILVENIENFPQKDPRYFIGLNLRITDDKDTKKQKRIVFKFEFNTKKKIKFLSISLNENLIKFFDNRFSNTKLNINLDSPNAPIDLSERKIKRYNLSQSYLEELDKKYSVDLAFPSFNCEFSSQNKDKDKTFLINYLGLNKFEQKEDIFNSFLKSLISTAIFQGLKSGNNYLTFFPSKNGEFRMAGQGPGVILLYEKLIRELENKPLLKHLIEVRNECLANISNIIFDKANIAESISKDFIDKSLKAAVAAIISRNGSHGLGSHVLPDVSHTPHNPYDNQQLFTYLGQRLDFIAQVASAFPNWSFPAWFTSDIMMRFFMQRSILNTLIKTENLTGYEFEYPDEIVEENWFKKNKLKELKEDNTIIVHGFVGKVLKSPQKNEEKQKNWRINLIQNHPDAHFPKNNEDKFLECWISKKKLVIEKEFADSQFEKGQQIRLLGRVTKKESGGFFLKDCKLIHQKLVLKIRKRTFIQFEGMHIKDEENNIKWKNHPKNKISSTSALIQEAVDAGKRKKILKKLETQQEKPMTVYGVIWSINLKKEDKETQPLKELILLSPAQFSNKAEDQGLLVEFKNPIPNDDKRRIVLRIGRRVIIEGKMEIIKIDGDNFQLKMKDAVIKEVVAINYLVGEWLVRGKNSDQLNKDIPIAIPGGVVGYQAFYTILENIIRNAAKHDWMTLNNQQKFGRNLEVKIELEEKAGQDFLICKIWTNATDLRGKKQKGNHYEFSSANILDYEYSIKGVDTKKNMPTHHQLNEILKERLIEDTGELKRNNLGISETKIAAGFLSNQSLKLVGGFPESNTEFTLLQDITNQEAGFVKASAAWEAKGDDLIPRLGYKIKLLKPKELIIVTANKGSSKKWGEQISKKTQECKLVSYPELIKLSMVPNFSIDYDFCVILTNGLKDLKNEYKTISLQSSFLGLLSKLENATNLNDFPEENQDTLLRRIEFYPYRLFLVMPNKKWEESIFRNKNTENAPEKLKPIIRFIKQRIIFLKEEEFEAKLFINEKKDYFSIIEAFKIRLYHKWIRKMRPLKYDSHERNQKPKIQLIEFDLGLKEKGYKRNLLEDNSIIRGTYQTFKKFIIEKFLDLMKSREDKTWRNSLTQFEPKEFAFSGQTAFINNWAYTITKKNWPDMKVQESLTSAFEEYKRIFVQLYAKRADIIETLPMIFRPPQEKAEKKGKEKENILQNGSWRKRLLPDIKDDYLDFQEYHKLSDKKKEELQTRIKDVGTIRYIRHGNVKKGTAFYLDYLSGGQIFYSVLKEYPDDQKNWYAFNRLMMQLIENPIPKLMIIDERVTNYVNRYKYRQRLSNLNIIIPDCLIVRETGKPDLVLLNTKEEENLEGKSLEIPIFTKNKTIIIKFHDPANTKYQNEQQKNNPDFPYQHRIGNLVIHHSILEEIFKSDLKSAPKEARGKSLKDVFIRKTKLKHIPSVIVTSGKGEPADLSVYSKFLPFSNIESYLLQSRPEKFLLSQILLKTNRSDFRAEAELTKNFNSRNP